MTDRPTVPGSLTGREPRLSQTTGGGKRLSLRGLANLLSSLDPSQISLEAAEAALHSTTFFVRYNAAQMLAKRADREARLTLQKVLETGDAPTRATAVRHLYPFSWFSVEATLTAALQDEDSRVREGAVYALCDMRQTAAFHLLATALQQESDSVRLAAAWGLRECADPEAVPVLAAVLKANDPAVRVQALEALGANGTSEAAAVTRTAFTDPDPEVQYAAVLTILELRGELSLGEVADLIAERRGEARAAVMRGLFHATNYLGIDLAHDEATDAVIDALEDALHENSPAVRIAAVWPLAWLRLPRTNALLSRAYAEEPDEAAKATMLKILVSLMVDGAEPLLEAALHSDQVLVREMAAQIMRDRGGRAAVRYDESDTARHGLSTPHMGEDD